MMKNILITIELTTLVVILIIMNFSQKQNLQLTLELKKLIIYYKSK